MGWVTVSSAHALLQAIMPRHATMAAEIKTVFVVVMRFIVWLHSQIGSHQSPYVVVKPGQWATVKPGTKNSVQIAGKSVAQSQRIEMPPAEQWPLLKQIDIADSLRSGLKVTLLYHYDCSKCVEAIPLYEEMVESLDAGDDAIQIAFVELPPYGPEDESPVWPDTKCLTGKLVSEKEIFVRTPLVVITRDGQVINAWEGEAPALDTILDTIFAEE